MFGVPKLDYFDQTYPLKNKTQIYFFLFNEKQNL